MFLKNPVIITKVGQTLRATGHSSFNLRLSPELSPDLFLEISLSVELSVELFVGGGIDKAHGGVELKLRPSFFTPGA